MFESCETWYEIVSLEYESYLLPTELCFLVVRELESVPIVKEICSTCWLIEESYDIHERGLATSRRSHDRYKFPILYSDINSLKYLDSLCSDGIAFGYVV